MKRTSPVFRVFTLLFSAVYLAGNCVLAHSYETAFWSERAKSAVISSSVLPSLPALKKELQVQAVKSTRNGTALGGLKLSSQLGQVRGLTPSQSHGKSLVFLHINDVHLNVEAQKNISDFLVSLFEQQKDWLVVLEGTDQAIDLTDFHRFPRPASVKKTADYYLSQNKISGAFHAAMVSSQKIPVVYGVDDKTHYEANIQAYRDSVKNQATVKAQLANLETALSEKKQVVFTPDLLAFDRQVEAYRQRQIRIGDYIGVLQKRNFSSQQLSQFAEAVRLENEMNVNHIEAERSRLLSLLMSRINSSESQQLIDLSLQLKSGQITAFSFYQQLSDLCRKKQLSLSDYPSMRSYLRYLSLCEQVDGDRLFSDLRTAEDSAFAQLARSTQEKELVAESKALELKKKLVGFSLTKDEWESYQTFVHSPLSIDHGLNLSSFERFYRHAEARDAAMAHNVARLVKETKATHVALVTGGFHSNGMARLLKADGLQAINWIPKLTKVDAENGSAYLNVFTQQKTPLEKLVEGQKLFVSIPPASLAHRIESAGAMSADAIKAEPSVHEEIETWLAEFLKRNNFVVEGSPVIEKKDEESFLIRLNIPLPSIKHVLTEEVRFNGEGFAGIKTTLELSLKSKFYSLVHFTKPLSGDSHGIGLAPGFGNMLSIYQRALSLRKDKPTLLDRFPEDRRKEIKRIIYPLSGYDQKLPRSLFLCFPNLKEVILVSFDFEKEADAFLRTMKKDAEQAGLKDVTIRLSHLDYFENRIPRIATGKTLFVDKYVEPNHAKLHRIPGYERGIRGDAVEGDYVLSLEVNSPFQWNSLLLDDVGAPDYFDIHNDNNFSLWQLNADDLKPAKVPLLLNPFLKEKRNSTHFAVVLILWVMAEEYVFRSLILGNMAQMTLMSFLFWGVVVGVVLFSVLHYVVYWAVWYAYQLRGVPVISRARKIGPPETVGNIFYRIPISAVILSVYAGAALVTGSALIALIAGAAVHLGADLYILKSDRFENFSVRLAWLEFKSSVAYKFRALIKTIVTAAALTRVWLNGKQTAFTKKWIPDPPRVRILGGARQVGANAIWIESAGSKILVDYGYNLGAGPRIPLDPPSEPDLVVITHAHTDHVGSLPIVLKKYGFRPTVYASKATVKLLSKELMKLSQASLLSYGITHPDIQQTIKSFVSLETGPRYQLNNGGWLRLHQAGHIPGSRSVEVGSMGGVVLASGDLLLAEQRTVQAAKIPKFLFPDLLLMESTNGGKKHFDREKEIERMLTLCRETFAQGGSVVIPALSVARSQEILTVLRDAQEKEYMESRNKTPSENDSDKKNGRIMDAMIFFDGMVSNVNRIYDQIPYELPESRQKTMLMNGNSFLKGQGVTIDGANGKTDYARRRLEFANKKDRPVIIVASSGMLQGGSIMMYLEKAIRHPKNLILFVNYQPSGGPGDRLFRARPGSHVYLRGRKVTTYARVEKIEVSGHASGRDLALYANEVHPQRGGLVLNHGDRINSNSLANRPSVKRFRPLLPENDEEVIAARPPFLRSMVRLLTNYWTPAIPLPVKVDKRLINNAVVFTNGHYPFAVALSDKVQQENGTLKVMFAHKKTSPRIWQADIREQVDLFGLENAPINREELRTLLTGALAHLSTVGEIAVLRSIASIGADRRFTLGEWAKELGAVSIQAKLMCALVLHSLPDYFDYNHGHYSWNGTKLPGAGELRNLLEVRLSEALGQVQSSPDMFKRGDVLLVESNNQYDLAYVTANELRSSSTPLYLAKKKNWSRDNGTRYEVPFQIDREIFRMDVKPIQSVASIKDFISLDPEQAVHEFRQLLTNMDKTIGGDAKIIWILLQVLAKSGPITLDELANLLLTPQAESLLGFKEKLSRIKAGYERDLLKLALVQKLVSHSIYFSYDLSTETFVPATKKNLLANYFKTLADLEHQISVYSTPLKTRVKLKNDTYITLLAQDGRLLRVSVSQNDEVILTGKSAQNAQILVSYEGDFRPATLNMRHLSVNGSAATRNNWKKIQSISFLLGGYYRNAKSMSTRIIIAFLGSPVLETLMIGILFSLWRLDPLFFPMISGLLFAAVHPEVFEGSKNVSRPAEFGDMMRLFAEGLIYGWLFVLLAGVDAFTVAAIVHSIKNIINYLSGGLLSIASLTDNSEPNDPRRSEPETVKQIVEKMELLFSPDLNRDTISAQYTELLFRLLAKTGALPAPEQEDIVSIGNGADPNPFARSTGIRADAYWPTDPDLLKKTAIEFNELFGTQIDGDKVFENNKWGAMIADFEQTDVLFERLAELEKKGLRPKTFLLKHFENFFVGHLTSREKIAEPEARRRFKEALTRFIARLPADSTAIVVESPMRHRLHEKIFQDRGFVDVLPRLVSPSELEVLTILGMDSYTLIKTKFNLAFVTGGQVQVFRKHNVPTIRVEKNLAAVSLKQYIEEIDVRLGKMEQTTAAIPEEKKLNTGIERIRNLMQKDAIRGIERKIKDELDSQIKISGNADVIIVNEGLLTSLPSLIDRLRNSSSGEVERQLVLIGATPVIHRQLVNSYEQQSNTIVVEGMDVTNGTNGGAVLQVSIKRIEELFSTVNKLEGIRPGRFFVDSSLSFDPSETTSLWFKTALFVILSQAGAVTLTSKQVDQLDRISRMIQKQA